MINGKIVNKEGGAVEQEAQALVEISFRAKKSGQPR
jgi:hypothetical protein